MIPAGTRVFFAVEPADLRRSFDGLAATAAAKLGRDPREGGLFVFFNRRADQVRILFRDPHGWCILAKRLDRARFRPPQAEEGRVGWETELSTLLRLLDDVVTSPEQTRRRKPNHGSARKLSVVQPELR